MKLFKLSITILILTIFASGYVGAQTSKKAVPSKNSAELTQTKKPATKNSKSRRVRSKAKTVDYTKRREELRRLDSLRLRNGGTNPIPRLGEEVESIAQIEPVLLRFRRADSTLSLRTIESLYFTRRLASGENHFFGQIVPKVDAAIEREDYAEALKIAKKGLYRNPLHIGLLKRACDLAQHEGDGELEQFIWQISELFYLIQHTGDALSPETARRAMSVDDALLFETLWLDTAPEQILQRKMKKHRGADILVLSLRTTDATKVEERYYLIGKNRRN